MYPIFDPYKPIPEFDELENIWAYTNKTSVAQGESIHFHVRIDTNEESYPFTIQIYRQEESEIYIETLNGTSWRQTTNLDPYINGCGWQSNYTYTIPNDTNHPSGAYIARISASGFNSIDVIFFVKSANPGVSANILFVSPVTTWQAYNTWGGKSLYYGEDYKYESRARKVSFNRPVIRWWFDQWEIQFIKWFFKAKANGKFPNTVIEFCTSVDIHDGSLDIEYYKLIISVGHDEYWSKEMRDTIENYFSDPNINGNVAFFSSNVCWWQVRFEPDSDDNPNRKLVCYKEVRQPDDTYSPGEDPYLLSINIEKTTCNWFDVLPNRPENLMTGVSYYWGSAFGSSFTAIYRVSLQRHWLLKDTGLNDRDEFGGELFNELFETDAADFTDLDRNFPISTGKLAFDTTAFSAPKDLMILASANLTELGEHTLTWDGPSGHNGWATMGIYRKPPNGGFVFHAGNYNWARFGLSPYLPAPPNENWNEFCAITKNILDIFGIDFQDQAFLLLNPGFENWLGGMPNYWNRNGAGTVTQAPGYEGSSALIDSTNGETFLSQQYIPIRTNRYYRVSCYAKPNDSPAGNITVSLQIIDQFGIPGDDIITASYTGSGDWQHITNEDILSDSEDKIVQVRVKIMVESGHSAYFDNVLVEEL